MDFAFTSRKAETENDNRNQNKKTILEILTEDSNLWSSNIAVAGPEAAVVVVVLVVG